VNGSKELRLEMRKNQAVHYEQGRVFGVYSSPFRNFFQFSRVFKEKNPKIPPKFCRPYKNISKPLPQKNSGYAPEYDGTLSTVLES